MSLSRGIRNEIRQAVYDEMIELEHVCEHTGSYEYLVMLGGVPTLAHTAAGPVLRHLPPHLPFYDCGMGT